MEEGQIGQSMSLEYCGVLVEYGKCLKQTAKACRGDIIYLSSSAAVRGLLNKYNCSTLMPIEKVRNILLKVSFTRYTRCLVLLEVCAFGICLVSYTWGHCANFEKHSTPWKPLTITFCDLVLGLQEELFDSRSNLICPGTVQVSFRPCHPMKFLRLRRRPDTASSKDTTGIDTAVFLVIRISKRSGTRIKPVVYAVHGRWLIIRTWLCRLPMNLLKMGLLPLLLLR